MVKFYRSLSITLYNEEGRQNIQTYFKMQILAIISLILLSVASSFKVSQIIRNVINKNILPADENENIFARSPIQIQKKENAMTTYRRKQLRLKDMRAYEALSDAFVGGTVGVMSVAFILEVRKVGDQRLDGCPYCLGNGEILCGSCYGNPSGVFNAEGAACSCSLCNGRGLIQCINCKGDGRITPILLQSKAIRDPDYSNPQLQERNKK